jgi:glycosyltransferase involved in cell wall biosynthesis
MRDDAARHVVPSIRIPFYRELRLPLPPFFRTRRVIERFQPDLVHIATEAALGLAILRFTRKRRIPTVSSFHTNFDQYASHYQIGWATGTIWRYLRWFHNGTRETYVPSEATRRGLETRGFERLVLWPRGVNSGLFCPDRPARTTVRDGYGFSSDDVVIAHVGRLAAEKNIGTLIRVFEIVTDRRPKARVLIVGDGPARKELEQRLGPRAHYAGYQSSEELADHYAAADAFAFASLTETFGNVILEAMSSGLPVVAIRAGGPGDTVRHGETGFLVEPSERPDQMADRLIELIDNESLRRTLSASARAYAMTQSWDTIMTALRSRYLDIVGSGANRVNSVSRSIA